MGAKYPRENVNKKKVLSQAEKDGFRGNYIPWGNIHKISMVMGLTLGMLVTCFIFEVSI